MKVRTPTRRQRLKKSLDEPRKINVSPNDPEFDGRITTELNSVYGPR